MQAMGTMNKRMNVPALAKIMREFERQNAKMDQVEEMMGDAMDDVFEVRFRASLQYLLFPSCLSYPRTVQSLHTYTNSWQLQEGDEEEETDKLVMQVFEEIGINAADGMVSAPQVHVPAQQAAVADAAPEPVAAEAGPSGVDAELEARLNALRGK